MSIDLYDISISVFLRTLSQLSSIVDKAEAYNARATIRIDPTDARLYPDMHPLAFQIQACCYTCTDAIHRVANTTDITVENSEKTLSDLQVRISSTIQELQSVKKEDLSGKEDAKLGHVHRGVQWSYTGTEYMTEFAIPNLLFHAGMTYAILRANGVPIGKQDWLGAVKERHTTAS
jgi:hypothetical protein